MEEKYKKVGLNFDYIKDAYPNLDEYDKTVSFYLNDENFELLKGYLEDEDYAMAKDATKGLYILASELRLYPLYQALLEIYEDLEAETYEDLMNHYKEMIEIYKKIRSIF